MDILFEFIVELIFEGSIEISSNKKISKWIRYPLIVFIVLAFIAIIALCIIVGVKAMHSNKIVRLFLILIGIFLLIGSIWKFRKLYLTKNKPQL